MINNNNNDNDRNNSKIEQARRVKHEQAGRVKHEQARRVKHEQTHKISRLLPVIVLAFLVSGCSGYKTSWDCPKSRGIGCSSIGYADEMAKEQILLNTGIYSEKTILINQDPLGEDYKETLIGNE